MNPLSLLSKSQQQICIVCSQRYLFLNLINRINILIENTKQMFLLGVDSKGSFFVSKASIFSIPYKQAQIEFEGG